MRNDVLVTVSYYGYWQILDIQMSVDLINKWVRIIIYILEFQFLIKKKWVRYQDTMLNISAEQITLKQKLKRKWIFI